MSRLSNIPKDEALINTIKLACIDFENSLGLKRGEARKQLIKALNLKSTNVLNNYFNAYENKFFRIEELFIILDVFELEQQKLILDYIADKYNFVLTTKAESTKQDFNLDKSLLNINALTGALNLKYIEYKTNDNILDEIEIENLLSESYHARQALVNYENKLRGLLR